MDSDRLRTILADVQNGKATVDEALALLKDWPVADLGYARLDLHRALRRGVPEVVLCQGKTPHQVATIVARLAQSHARVLATRADPRTYEAVQAAVDTAEYFPVPRLITVRDRAESPATPTGRVAVATGGTSDLPVAEEASITAEFFGCRVDRFLDVGVAGLHRLLAVVGQLREADVIIAVAGMEASLPTVLAGLVDRPVIGVPTSVGYGAHLQGLVPLFAILNSCVPGLTAVNVDNGFGAGYTAALICRSKEGTGSANAGPEV